jgi:hypothetical protein
MSAILPALAQRRADTNIGALQGSFSRAADGRCVFMFSTLVTPNPVGGSTIPPNILLPGKYEFELVLAGDNVKPRRHRWRLEFPPNWSEDEQRMLSQIAVESL